MARFILRRAGIKPLLPALVAFVIVQTPDSAQAQNAAQVSAPSVRATALATARANILPSSARIERGRFSLTQTGPALNPQPEPSTRPCDAAAPAANPACRMIVYDLP